jgi:Mg2+-importing ATPase
LVDQPGEAQRADIRMADIHAADIRTAGIETGTHGMTQTTHHQTSSASSTTLPFWSMSEGDVEGWLSQHAATASPSRSRNAHAGWARIGSGAAVFGRQFLSPITLILVVAALIAMVTGDFVDGGLILVIVVCSALLGAWQEGRAADAVSALLTRVAVTVTVVRAGHPVTVQTTEVLPGDRLTLSAGDLIPADCLLLTGDELMVDESALTGESYPATKSSGAPLPEHTALAGRSNSLFAGTHVISGTGTALVVFVGADTTFGHISTTLKKKPQATSFEIGVGKFGMLLLRVMLVLVGAILLINLLLHRSLIESLLFALALAVGITPQMLPVVVTVSLAAGARRMARNQVIVKRLDVIEDLGAMSVLCTDKTGTITVGTMKVDTAVDAAGVDTPAVLELAVLNAALQTGYPNPLDAAIVAQQKPDPGSTLLGELPYDFQRKRLSVVTEYRGRRTLITKGALDEVIGCCTSADANGATQPIEQLDADIRKRAEELGSNGLRVLGVAYRVLEDDEKTVDAASEKGLVFAGMLTFHDPVKDDVRDSIAALGGLGIAVKVISGDNRYVTGSLTSQLGLSGRVVVGTELDEANDAELRHLVHSNSLFAEVEPMHKVKIVTALKSMGETVGFLGDGINDAAALRTADVGVSVQTAVNVAKEAAAIVLLTQDLSVVATGVRLGRHTFANTLKYVRVAASSNFGNILSMVIAAALLPFLPMLPAQILLLNFLADIPNTLVSRDRVDRERLATAGVWDMRVVTRFMITFGALSTVFDLLTFAVLEWGFHANAELFHTGWFVESAITQFVAMMALRTGRPAWKSRPDILFFAVSAAIAVVTAVIPFTPLAAVIGFTPLPLPLIAVLLLVTLLYGLAIEGMKRIVKF